MDYESDKITQHALKVTGSLSSSCWSWILYWKKKKKKEFKKKLPPLGEAGEFEISSRVNIKILDRNNLLYLTSETTPRAATLGCRSKFNLRPERPDAIRVSHSKTKRSSLTFNCGDTSRLSRGDLDLPCSRKRFVLFAVTGCFGAAGKSLRLAWRGKKEMSAADKKYVCTLSAEMLERAKQELNEDPNTRHLEIKTLRERLDKVPGEKFTTLVLVGLQW